MTYLECRIQFDDVWMLQIVEQLFFPQYVPLLVEFADLHDAHHLDCYFALVLLLVGQAHLSESALADDVFYNVLIQLVGHRSFLLAFAVYFFLGHGVLRCLLGINGIGVIAVHWAFALGVFNVKVRLFHPLVEFIFVIILINWLRFHLSIIL